LSEIQFSGREKDIVYIQYTLVKDAQGTEKNRITYRMSQLSKVFMLKRKFMGPGKSLSLSKSPTYAGS